MAKKNTRRGRKQRRNHQDGILQQRTSPPTSSGASIITDTDTADPKPVADINPVPDLPPLPAQTVRPYFCTYTTVDVPPPVVVIRHNGRIDWSDHDSNAIGRFNQRLQLAYLANTRHADITFHIVAEHLDIPAHALIISVASEKLEQLCFGDGDGPSTNRRIDVPECSSSDFMVVLRYLYSGGTVAYLSSTNVVAISKIAKHFDLRHLIHQCCIMFSKVVVPKNACRLFNQLYPADNIITKKCLHLIVTHCAEMLRDGSMMAMSDDVLVELFDALANAGQRPDPVLVMQALTRWADTQLAATGQPRTGANRRSLLGAQRFQLISFESMSYRQFAQSLLDAGTDFLSVEEAGMWLKHILMYNPFATSEKHRVVGCSCGKREIDRAANMLPYAGKGKCCLDAKTLQFRMPNFAGQ